MNALLGPLLAAAGLAPGPPQLPDGHRPCSSGHSAHQSEFDAGKGTCRNHLSQKANARQERQNLQKVNQASSASTPTLAVSGTAELSGSSKASSRATYHGSAPVACDESDEDPTTLTANDWIKETITFDSLSSAQKFVQERGHEEGCMFLERNSSAEHARGRFYYRCHCYLSPAGTGKNGTSALFFVELTVLGSQ